MMPGKSGIEVCHILRHTPGFEKTLITFLTALSDEPITALVSDNQGLADIFTLIDTAKFYLEKGGLLAIEHGYDQAQAVQNRFIEQGFSQVATHKDRGGHDRVTFGVWDASL